ncbi:tetratricopeptide repeat protein [Bartonella quintana]|uniref:Cytochrome c-type biogenesis protein cycH n=2 Tax=Bartonella quintana TaxID=803 RepID=A0A0H3M2H2_BARQU|nr:tetratricopeptide repeat protein [Bartonella quintana]CAF25892.1 Cytochrome c-type biogenesis protein cycH [Bartonella quintana str. Toulouse]
MPLLNWAAIFLLLLAIAVFFSLCFPCALKKERRVLIMGIDGSRMYVIKSDKPYKHYVNRRALKPFSIFFIFLITWNVYALTGNPEVKSYFFSELMDKNPKMLSKREQLIRLQVLFFRTPNDGKLADALAVGYLEEGYFRDAVNMYLDALRLNGESAPRLVGYGLALIGYEGGTITQEAQNAFQKAADLVPNDFYPRLLLAEALHQAGKSAQAVQFLQNFLNTMPEDFAARSRVEAMIIQLRDLSD